MPKVLNNQPPTTAPTIPRTMSRTTPSPVLLMILLPMNPAMRPNTIQAIIDMEAPTLVLWFETRCADVKCEGLRAACAQLDGARTYPATSLLIEHRTLVWYPAPVRRLVRFDGFRSLFYDIEVSVRLIFARLLCITLQG